jgi:hypothetical protein
MSDLDKVSNQILKTKSEKKLISLWEELTVIKQNTQDPNDIIKIESIIKEIDMKMLQLQQKELDKINKLLSTKINIQK